MRSEMSDRPVSLAAVIETIDREIGHLLRQSNVYASIEALPTFAPATHGGLTIPEHFDGQSPTHWVTLLLGHNPLLGALYDYACAVEKAAPEAVIVNRRDRLIAVADTFATAAPDAPKSVEEMADAIGAVRCHCGTGWLTQGDGCVQDDRVAELYAEHTAPTKPPREMPTPQPGMVVALVSGDEFYIPHNQYTTWRSVVSCLAPAVLRASESSIARIYWPGPTPVVIWERGQ